MTYATLKVIEEELSKSVRFAEEAKTRYWNEFSEKHDALREEGLSSAQADKRLSAELEQMSVLREDFFAKRRAYEEFMAHDFR